MFSGYGFWLILSKFTSSEIIGTSSALISISAIFISIVSIGIPVGVQRFVSRSFSEQKIENTKIFVKASLLLTCGGILVCSVLILVFSDLIEDTIAIDFSLIMVMILLIISSSISNLFRSVVVASLKTKGLPVIAIISGATKIISAIILVLIGTGALGITLGFTFFSIVSSILLAVNMAIIINSSKCKPEITLVDAIKNILNASVASWIPALISTLGTYLGTIVIFGTQGSTHAGIYFIAFSIFAALTTIISVLLSIAYPALSAMHDGRKRFTWKVIKITLIVALPFSASLIFHSEEIMQLFGPDYIKGSVILEMLSLSTLFSVVSSGITILAYSQGKYKQAVVIGIASSIPRVVLYFVLVPIYGEVGGALSYTIGSITGFLVSIIICKKIGLKISWKELGVISIIPIWIAFTLSYTEVFYVVSIIVTFMVSFVLFLKFQILTKSDVQDTVGVLPNSIAEPLTHLINKIGKKINRHY